MHKRVENIGFATILALSTLACAPDATSHSPTQRYEDSGQVPATDLSPARISGLKLEQLVIDFTKAQEIKPKAGKTNGKISIINETTADLLLNPAQLSSLAQQCRVNSAPGQFVLRYVDRAPLAGARPFPIRTSFTPGVTTIEINTQETAAYVQDELPKHEIKPNQIPQVERTLTTIFDNMILVSALCFSVDALSVNSPHGTPLGQLPRSQVIADVKAVRWKLGLLAGTTQAAIGFASKPTPTY